MAILSNKRQVLADASLNFPSVSANNQQVLTAAVKGAKVGDAVLVVPPASLDVAAIAATGTLTIDTKPIDGDTATIGAKTYTFKDGVSTANQVNIGATLATAQANLVKAFNLSGVAGTDYGTGTTAHPTVNISAFAANVATLTAKTAGTAGNSIGTTETFDAGTNVFGGATLSGGAASRASGLIVDGYVSAAGVVTVRASNIFGTASDPVAGTFRIAVWV